MIDGFNPFFVLQYQSSDLGSWLYLLIFEGNPNWFPYYMAVHLSGSALALLLAWSFTENCRRAYFRVAMRSLALAFTFCFIPAIIMFAGIFPAPGWPLLFINSVLTPYAWLTFSLEFALFHRWLWKRELRKVPGKAVFYEHQAREWWRPPGHGKDARKRR